MRGLLSFVFGLITMAAIVAMGIIVAQNDQTVHLTFLGNSLQIPQGWAVAGAAALGFVLSFLLLVPGRLANAMRMGSLSRQGQQLEQRLRQLREEHAQLQGSHQRLLAEHQTVLSQVLAPVSAGRQPAAPPAAAAAFAAEDPLKPTGPIHPRRAAAEAAARESTTEQPSLMDRIRGRVAAWKAQVQGWFRRQRDRISDRSSSNGPTPATT